MEPDSSHEVESQPGTVGTHRRPGDPLHDDLDAIAEAAFAAPLPPAETFIGEIRHDRHGRPYTWSPPHA